MKPTIVLAYSGGFASSVAIHWLIETHEAEVVTVTLDVGQGQDLGELRRRALTLGAVRAHGVDARDELARWCLPASPGGGLRVAGLDPRIDELPRPLVARKLVEIAALEGTRTVAHGGIDTSLDECIHASDPSMMVVAPAREWRLGANELASYARACGVPARGPAEAACRVDQNLWGRMVSWPDGAAPPAVVHQRGRAAQAEQARIDIHFEHGVPVSVNGVPMAPAELVESLGLIAGWHGIGRIEMDGGGRRVVYDAPAAVVLHAALALAADEGGVVRLELLNGQYTVLAPDAANSNL